MKVKRIAIILVVLVFLGGLGYFLFSKVFNKPSRAAFQINTTPDAEVYLNAEMVGTTPFFDNDLEVGEYAVKLVPQGDQGLAPWEGKINLVANVVTSISYEFNQNEELASGKIVSLEKIGDPKMSSLNIVTDPEGGLVKVDGESRGFAPVSVENISPGEHRVTISAPGYVEKTVSPQTEGGYKLTMVVKLAREEMEGITEATESGEEEEATESAEEEEEEEEEAKVSPTPIDLDKPYVKILSTPTGWLRVRKGPSTGTEELTKVDPGEAFPYLDEEKNGWYKIEYEKDEEGWVSGVYAELVE